MRKMSWLAPYPFSASTPLTDDVFRPHPVRVESIEAICFYLLQIMAFSELSAATLFHFSKNGFQFYLSKTQRTSSDQTSDWCLEEYLRLRKVITWCSISAAYTIAAIEDLDRKCLPGPEIALGSLREGDKLNPANSRSAFDFSQGQESLVEKILKEDLDKFLSMVDLVSIHPELLVTLIEPLNHIDPLEWSRIYFVQVMRWSRRLRENAMYQATDVWHWAGREIYSMRTRFSNNLTFTVSATASDGHEFSAVFAAELKMDFSRRTFEWEIVAIPHGNVECGWIDLFDIGFYRLRPQENLGMKLRKHRWQPLSTFSQSSVLSITDNALEMEEEFFDRKNRVILRDLSLILIHSHISSGIDLSK